MLIQRRRRYTQRWEWIGILATRVDVDPVGVKEDEAY